MDRNRPYRVAIACQGGGSHTAFTAGVLKQILQKQADHFEIAALSGTSGGAICAFLAWYGLLHRDTARAIKLLDRFWEANAADTYLDLLTNAAVVFGQGQMVQMDVSPYWFPEWTRQFLRTLLEQLVRFDEIPKLVGKDSPQLHIGAVNVRSGVFQVFKNQDVTVEALLASAAIPTIFQSAPVNGSFYWDGLFSQNPPVRELAKLKPKQLWVIQINPPTRKQIPRTTEGIRDRRNELAGNLSLQQELYFIDKINEFVAGGVFCKDEYIHIDVKKVIMNRDLSYASKFNRDPDFLKDMMAYGEAQAQQLF
jgi:NTE family protein